MCCIFASKNFNKSICASTIVTTLWFTSLSKDIVIPSPLPNSFPCTCAISPTIASTIHIWIVGCTFPIVLITSEPFPFFPSISYSFKLILASSLVSPPPQGLNVSNFSNTMNYISAYSSIPFWFKCSPNLVTPVWSSSPISDNLSLYCTLSSSNFGKKL